jgi:hypothetical protein
MIILTRIQCIGVAHAARPFHDSASNISSLPNSYPRGEAYGDSGRNQTIINLLNVLSELSNESSLDNG